MMAPNTSGNWKDFFRDSRATVNALFFLGFLAVISAFLIFVGWFFGLRSFEISEKGIEFHYSDTKNNATIKSPDELITVIPGKNFSKQGTLQNISGGDWIIAACEKKNQIALSGLCTIDSEGGWGWMLQNAGLTGKNAEGLDTWGCAYRRGVFIVGTSGNSEKPFDLHTDGQWKTGIEANVRGAAGTAKATATVFCIEVSK